MIQAKFWHEDADEKKFFKSTATEEQIEDSFFDFMAAKGFGYDEVELMIEEGECGFSIESRYGCVASATS